MAVEKQWEHFFKPEVRKQGAEYFSRGAVSLSIAADTQIQAFVRVSSGAKVSFVSESIASLAFTADCSCSASSKGQFCKHIWATLLKVEESHPDFLDSKSEIEKGSGTSKFSQSKKPVQSEARSQAQEAMKTRQADYRKAQYQKQKQRLKDQKGAQKSSSKFSQPTTTYPADVEAALAYFAENGFPMENAISEESLRNAKRLLSRIFHPDKGGTHEEILTLNQNFDILLEYSNGNGV